MKLSNIYLKKDGDWSLFKKVGSGDLKSRNIKINHASIGDLCRLDNNISIDDGVTIGPSVRLYHGTRIDRDVIIAAGSSLFNGVLIERNVIIGSETNIGPYSLIGQHVSLGGSVVTYGHVRVGREVVIAPGARIGPESSIENTSDCVVIGPLGSRDSMLTGYYHDGYVWITTGCFCGSITDFENAVRRDYRGTRMEGDYLAASAYIFARIESSRRERGGLK